VAGQTDWNGALTTYVNDARGRPVSVVEAAQTPLARTITLSYHPAFRLPQRIVEAGSHIQLHLRCRRQPVNRNADRYHDHDRALLHQRRQPDLDLYLVEFPGRLVKKPRTDVAAVTQFTYDNSGALTATTNALGQTFRISEHLPGGLPRTIVDPNGVNHPHYL